MPITVQGQTRPAAEAIRPVARADVPAIKAVIDATGLFPAELLDDMIAGYLNGQGGDDVWLTVDGGPGAAPGHDGPLAVAYVAPERMTSGTWNLYLIAVHPANQGRGVGAALVRRVESALAARGARVLLVETSGLPAFERTRAFYRANGYDEEARIRAFYAAGEDKVVFRKALAAPGPMHAAGLADTLATLFAELVDGAGAPPSYMLNSGDAGLLRSLDRLSAAEASAVPPGGASVAAHADHVRFGLSLMNRWAAGEADPFTDADWAASWRRTAVSDSEWGRLRAALGDEAHRWRATLGTPRAADAPALANMVGSLAHLAYHLGAVRQIARTARGPAEDE